MERLEQFRTELTKRSAQKQMSEDELGEAKADAVFLRQDRQNLQLAREILASIAKMKREETTNKIERIVTHGLQSVLGDDSVRLRVNEHQTKKNISYQFAIDGKGFTSEDIKNEKGGGIQNLVSFLLSVVITLMLSPSRTRFFVFDEKFAQLSRDYLPATGSLLKELSEHLGCQFLLVTHQQELSDYADIVYELSQSKKGITSATRIV